MVKFNGIPLPELVKDFDKVKPKVFVQRIIPKKKVAYRRVVGDYGYEIVVRGLIESNLPTRGEIDEALQNAVEILEGFADGESHELDLEDHSDHLFCLAIDPRFSRMAYNKISYEITFMQTSLVQFGTLQDSVSIADVLSGVPGKVGLLEDFVGVSENIKHYKGVGGIEYGFGTVGSQNYPRVEDGLTGSGSDQGLSTYNTWFTKLTIAGPKTVKEIHVYIKTAVGNKRLSLYDNSGTNVLLGQTSTFVGSSGAWAEISLTTAYHIAAGSATFWLGVTELDGNAELYQSTAGSAGDAYLSATSYVTAGFPSTLDIDALTSSNLKCQVHTSSVQIKGFMKRGSKFTLPSQKEIYFVKIHSHVQTGHARVSVFDEQSPKNKKWESESVALSVGSNVILISSGTPSTLTLPAADYGVWWQYDDVGDAPSYTAGAAGNGRYLAQAYGAFPATISGDTSTAEKWTETLAELGWEEIV
jgi:hypothetical protein